MGFLGDIWILPVVQAEIVFAVEIKTEQIFEFNAGPQNLSGRGQAVLEFYNL